MPAADNQKSMQTPPAPAFDGNNPRSPLSGDAKGKSIYPSPPNVGAAPPDRTGGGIVVQGSPVQTKVGVLAPVVGLEQYGSGKVINAPSSQAKTTPVTVITNVDPLASDKTPGYGGR